MNRGVAYVTGEEVTGELTVERVTSATTGNSWEINTITTPEGVNWDVDPDTISEVHPRRANR